MDGSVIVDRNREVNVWNYDDKGNVGIAVDDGGTRAAIVLNEAQTARLIALLNESIDEMRRERNSI